MLTVQEAKERIAALWPSTPPTERLSIENALGKVLMTPVVARRTLPPWDNSAMDGYAVAGDAIESQRASRLRVIETIHAGQTPTQTVREGKCARIMTGARVPAGAVAVVMQEKVTVTAEGVELTEAPRAGDNIRRAGEDVQAGETLFNAGTVLDIGSAGMLWGQGIAVVEVPRAPTVAIVTSGDELCSHLEPVEGKIIDSNSPVIAALARKAGAQVTTFGISPDELNALTQTLEKMLTFDVVIAIAGASVGEKDFTKAALERLGVDMNFWKVAMKPGKPLAVGRKGNTLVFGLPGNPISAMVTFELFVRPTLRALQGVAPFPPEHELRVTAPLKKPAGLQHFIRARIEQRADGAWVTPLPNQSSGALRSACGATHLISLPPETTSVQGGDKVRIVPVSWTELATDHQLLHLR